jgi:HlyD family secretion protein
MKRPLFLAVLAAFGLGCSGKKDGTRYETVKVERGKLVARVTATGTLNALVTVQVSSQVSGRMRDVLVDFNSEVKKGQVLARLDPALFEAAVEQARANLAVATANAVKAKVQADDSAKQSDRARSLFERKLIAEAESDTAIATASAAKASVAAADAQVIQARAQLNQATVNLQYATITSPVSGTVISRAVDPGQTVAASLQAPTLFTIAEDLRKMQVETSVSESDIGRIAPGMKASFVVDAYPTERFTGTVRQVRNAAIVQQSVVTYTTVIDVENAELRLKPGMTANVTFIYAERDDILKAPNAVLRFRPPAELAKRGGNRRAGDGTERTVWRKNDDGMEPVSVQVGISDGTVTELVSAEVKEGDALITEIKEEGRAGSGGPPGGGRRGPF